MLRSGVTLQQRTITSLQASNTSLGQPARPSGAVCVDKTLKARLLRPQSPIMLISAAFGIGSHKRDGMQELTGFSLVANCSGLGAARLFQDPEMYPVRGHVIRVRAPWIK